MCSRARMREILVRVTPTHVLDMHSGFDPPPAAFGNILLPTLGRIRGAEKRAIAAEKRRDFERGPGAMPRCAQFPKGVTS